MAEAKKTFKCPHCDYSWTRKRDGTYAPLCEKHGVMLLDEDGKTSSAHLSWDELMQFMR
jgi:transposase-like protein